jgi:tripartite-type tricarboxylate transporter receptor subunit TctC
LPQHAVGRTRRIDTGTARMQTALMDVDPWYGLLAPAGTPPAVVTLLNQQVNEILGLQDVRASLAQQGLDPIQKPAQALTDLIARDLVRWADVIRRANITAD